MKTGELFVDENIKQAACIYARNLSFFDECEYNMYRDGFIAGVAYILMLNPDLKDKIKTKKEDVISE